jgi:hypothetical protein
MSETIYTNFDRETRQLLAAAAQIAPIFDSDNPEIRPEFIMVAVCALKGGVCEWLFDFMTSEVSDFKTLLLVGLAGAYDVKLPDVVRKLQHVPSTGEAFGVLGKHVEQIIKDAQEDWVKRKPKTKALVPIDYFLGAMLLHEGELEVLDLALMECEFSREDMFAYLMSSSAVIDGKYPRQQVAEFHDFGEAAEFLGVTITVKPAVKKSRTVKRTVEAVEARMRKHLIGQDEAIQVLMRAMRANAAGLKDPEKPVGVFLFAGHTGVGKTEAARQLAAATGMPLKRFDMSEYDERHSVMRLYGAPPSYVGYDEGGQLTNFVSKNPASIVVLDEIEKAHPDVMNVLLQIAEEGTLTDGKGMVVKFDQVMLVLTTNIGSKDAARNVIGFGTGNEGGQRAAFDKAVREYFKPEMRGRFTATVIFERLTPDSILRITALELAKLAKRIKANRGISLRFSANVRSQIAASSNAEQYGARDVKKNIARLISEPLANYVLEHKASGGVITVSYSAKTGFKFSSKNSS